MASSKPQGIRYLGASEPGGAGGIGVEEEAIGMLSRGREGPTLTKVHWKKRERTGQK